MNPPPPTPSLIRLNTYWLVPGTFCPTEDCHRPSSWDQQWTPRWHLLNRTQNPRAMNVQSDLYRKIRSIEPLPNLGGKGRGRKTKKKKPYRILDLNKMLIWNEETHTGVTLEAGNAIISNWIMWSCFFIPVFWLHINQFWLDSKITEHAPQRAVKFYLIM